MTAVTVVDCNPCQRLVRNVIGRRSIRRWIGSTVTGRTLIGNQRLGVIPACRFPSRNAVATGAIGTGWNVNAVLSRGIGTVMATGAVGCTREGAVIRLGTGPVGSGLMTTVTRPLCRQVSRRLASGHGPVMASCTRPGNNARVTEFGTTERLCRMTGFTPLLSRQVLLRLHHIVSS